MSSIGTVSIRGRDMMNLFELMLAARNTRAAPDLGLQFALSEAQVKMALRYLVPLFGDAVIRMMMNQQGLATLLGHLASPQHQMDANANDLFQSSRILSNGTGLLSLLFHNEATIQVVASYAARGAEVDPAIIRRMLPYVATMYMGALSVRAREPLEKLAVQVENTSVQQSQAQSNGQVFATGQGRGMRWLAQFVVSTSATPQAAPKSVRKPMSIKDILATLSNIEKEEEQMLAPRSMLSH